MGKLNRLFSIFVLLIVLFFGGVVFGQEGTEEAVVVDPTPGTVIEVPVEAPAEQPEGVTVNVVNVIIGLLTAFAAGGIVGIAGLAIFIDRIRKDTATVTAMEKLGDSFPPSTKEILEKAFSLMEKASNLGVEIFDSTPMADKPQTPPSEPFGHIGNVG